MNNPYVESEGQKYRILSVKGDKWKCFSSVTFDEKWGRFALRHEVNSNGPLKDMAFCYFPIGEGVAKPVRGSDIMYIRCWLWTPGDGEPDGLPFKGKLFVEPYSD